MTKKVRKRKLNIKRTLVFGLFIYIIGYMVYYVFTTPIKHIEINGNNLIKDKDIIINAKLKEYPSIMKYSNKTIENNIKNIKLIESVNVKKKLGSIISIDIKEKRLLLYYLNTNKILTSDNTIIDNNFNNVLGIPTLTNEVENKILYKFIYGFSKLNNEILYEINEIDYYPKYDKENNIINKERFRIRMNDGNIIIVNVNTVDTLNKYNEIYSSLNGKKGIIDLDSSKVTNLIFTPFEE